ncbi:type IV secretory system conjugative DNA transfer family protein [Paenibacillus sp. p3-SID867]|uniref:type IV secretory system conjugative DNA transfer family protein n=1 Tax=Paenibacillus sp. p3-SID867 TaxID=2916363 RepID=UPI0021A59793|nr:type IV secretory system conjugative DNA transfer family protein [Paenibacillus sp. p3-SID867]MCT1402896.1 type IV secretory system conjugative DNA transfer family protein [Paenibacillus sp. p3-SID867]
MKYIGMVIGGIFSAIGHMVAFIFKNIYIAIRRFTLDPANKNAIWNIQAFSLLILLLFIFLWLVGKYQDVIYGVDDPVVFRAIPIILACFLGHSIYSCPALYQNQYAKPLVQTFLNALSILAIGQLILAYTDRKIGLLIALVLFILTIFTTLYYTLRIRVSSTIFSKLSAAAEENKPRKDHKKTSNSHNEMERGEEKPENKFSWEEINELDSIDLNTPGCLSHLRYYSEQCELELFYTRPTKERQSQLMKLNRSDRAQHGQIIAGTGAGKTLFATNLITQDLLNDYIGSTVIDPKGSLIKRMANFLDRIGRKYYRLDPLIVNSDCLNPFFVPESEDIEPMIERNVAAFHAYLGPDAQIYFKSRATQLFRVGVKALKLVYGNEVTYNELDRLIQPINDDFRVEVLHEITLLGKEGQVALLREYTRNMAGSPKMQEHAMQTYSNLYDYLSELTSNKYIQKMFCGKSTFSIDEAMKNGEIILFNGAYGTLQTLTYTAGRLFLNLMRASTFRRNMDGNVRPHQLTIDEVEMFADEEFSTFMEMAREFEVFVNVIHQGNEQLDDVSKRLGAMVKQNAVQKFIMAGLDPNDAKYYSEMIGEEYKIGQSSGTDEMSTTGFKTQIKEEKRFTVMPKEILSLKGYNPETGDPAECLFRGVHNNVRLDPVIGLIYPLPKVLFTPLEVKGEDEINEEIEDVQETIKVENEKREGEMDDIKTKDNNDKLENIKKKAQHRKELHTNAREIETKTEINEPTTVRSPLWDEQDSVNNSSHPVENTSNGEEGGSIVSPRGVTFRPASIDDKALKLAQQIKNDAQISRNEKKSSKTE